MTPTALDDRRLARRDRLVLRRLLRDTRVVGAGVIALAAVWVVVISTLVLTVDGLAIGVLSAAQPLRWSCYVLGIVLAMGLRTYVAFGVTRRDYVRGASAYAVVGAVTGAALVVAVQLVVDGVAALADRPYELDAPPVVDGAGDVVGSLALHAVLLTGYVVSGALGGGLFARLPWWAALALLPVSLLPGLGVDLALSSGTPASLVGAAAGPAAEAAGLAVAAAVVALGWLGVRRLGADAPVTAPTS